jgi:hypothetical protein
MPITLNGSAGVTTNSGAVYNGISSGTAVTASGTSVDFTSIPSWVKRITIMFNGVSLSGTANILVQLGTGGIASTSGYLAGHMYVLTSGAQAGGSTATNGFPIQFGSPAYTVNGNLILTLIDSNKFTASGVIYNNTSVPYIDSISGISTLSGILNMVRITTTTGTDTFDAGSINILYE